ncbi:PTS fructose transporter subunit IIB [Alteribacillus sp. JSM 102045]|uniref:PTS fructose transporter subunit IIB n=1 Tax=Alteribacillus sp. JSM 102045 TaxID=1562101 RepID=UPI0035C15978
MKIIAVTACPAGVAHTHMAAAALEAAAKKSGVKIKVEKQGAMGMENEIKAKEIADADALILAVDTAITKSERFNDIPTVKASVAEAVKNAQELIDKAMNVETNQ